MRFTELPLRGVYTIEIEEHRDERGFFARTFCRREYAAHGLSIEVAQRSTSVNTTAGTLRGMHYQTAPRAETKTVRCVCGSIYDVVIDLRPESPTYCRWFGLELSADNHKMLYIPPGLAHGFETLTANAEVDYQISGEYSPEFSRGVRWNDPAFDVRWPFPPVVISARDHAYPDFVR
jgi:dTDP-4-dehydrorhamnose 3,5-epimerase